MKKLVLLCSLVFTPLFTSANECPDVLKFMKRKLNSQETVNMCKEYRGKTLLIVNTASKCGYTPQFEGLEALYSELKDKDFVVLGFPSHDFKQEFSDESQTAELCELTYGVEFPMFEVTNVKGKNADPLFRKLSKQSGIEPGWNFYKYLVDKNGEVVNAYKSSIKPSDKEFRKDILDAIAR
ncbi:glutathione peroxidase [Aliiglaciecola sp. 3_MG-2023]|uniref:glutathione peroxidase n=1 Tax=Aliiglaciecola sp. 3_MG-2023 TaxID=3062644 RepID=UPI0026E39E42|nr:glutathione peroxidase [Aliiglaciecola sp. 3_MG-2023]MDO6692453.1 glutathione peroxidase [Aliiglaciecola sp. 3_MG-2023]